MKGKRSNGCNVCSVPESTAGFAIDGSFGNQTEGALRTFEEFNCPVTTCTVDGSILIDGPEWDVLAGLPELPRATFEPSP